MKQYIFTLVALLLGITSVQAKSFDHSQRPQAGPAPKVKLGKTQSFTLPNGMKVFVVENHKLPLISCDIQLDIRPELQGNMAGYKDMMSELLLTGTKTRTKDQMNAETDLIGARIIVSADEVSGSGLKKYDEKIFSLLSDIVMNATIKQEELEKIKKRSLSALETAKNQPDAMNRNVSSVVTFGKDHPYGEVATEESIKNITVEKCQNYYATYFRPNVAYMAIVGDVTLEEMKPLIEQYFGKWMRQDVPVTNYPTPATGTSTVTKVAFAPRNASVQSVVNVTYPIYLKPGADDVVKTRVANAVLGGGSQGRLFLDLREKHGWTYGAYSSIIEDDICGRFSATVKCRNVVSDSSVGAILEEMHLMQDEVTPDSVIQNCISYLSGNFAIGLEDPRRVAQYAINIERYHMRKDYYENFLRDLSKVTASDVQEVSRKYIKPESANIVVVGSKDDVAQSLAKYAWNGKVEYFDNYGQPVKQEERKAAPGNITADDIIKKYLHAIGGKTAVTSIMDITIVSSSDVSGIPLTITEIKKSPSKMKIVVEGTMNGQKMSFQKQVFNGTKGYVEKQGNKADMTPTDLAEAKRDADIAADLHPEQYHIIRTLTGVEQVNGKDAYVVEVSPIGKNKVTEYYDEASGLLVKKVLVVEGHKGAFKQVSEYSDYREVPSSNGYKIPYTVKETGEAGKTITGTVQSVVVNRGIVDTEFE